MVNDAYEMMVILAPQVSDKEENVIVEKIKKSLSSPKSLASVSLGIKAFAYPIQKNIQGKYLTLTFEAQGSDLKTIRDNFKHATKILRYLIIKKTDQLAHGKETNKKDSGKEK